MAIMSVLTLKPAAGSWPYASGVLVYERRKRLFDSSADLHGTAVRLSGDLFSNVRFKISKQTTCALQDVSEATVSGSVQRCLLPLISIPAGCKAGHPPSVPGVTSPGWCWSQKKSVLSSQAQKVSINKTFVRHYPLLLREAASFHFVSMWPRFVKPLTGGLA